MIASLILFAAPLLLSVPPVSAAPRWQGQKAAMLDDCDPVTATVQAPLGQTTHGVMSEGYNPLSTVTPSPANPPTQTPFLPATNGTTNGTMSGGYQNALYFTNWGIYGADFQPQQLPASQITHVLYAFADIGPDGEVHSSDSYADLEKHYPSDSWNDQGRNAYGCVKQLYMLKQQNRHMKVLLSIGGWTYSPKFAPVAATDAGRAKFAASAVQLVQDWGLDGIDIDWEYPANAQEAGDFVQLLKACRAALDAYAAASAPGYHFAITVAAPAGPQNYGHMDLVGMDQYIDSWHLMTYDYAGSWDSTSGHQANLHANDGTVVSVPTDDGSADSSSSTTTNGPGLISQGKATSLEAAKLSTKFNTDQAVSDYLAAGVAAHKIALGLPLYGRSFGQTAGLGQAFSGVGDGGSVQPGVWLYNALPRAGAHELYDGVAGASYSYDPVSRELVSYDTVGSAKAKAQYLLDHQLGGAFFWDASGDRNGSESLVGTLAAEMGALDASQNWLAYPQSQYDNIRTGMQSAAGVGATAAKL